MSSKRCVPHPSDPFDPNSNKFLDNLVFTCPGSNKKRNVTNYTGWLKPLACREGSKKDLLKCIFPLIPQGNNAPDLFVDLFMGSGVVALNYVQGLDVPKDGGKWEKSFENKKNASKVEKIKAKEGCEVWTNDLASIIPLTYKALQDIPKEQKEQFIKEVVEKSKKINYAQGPRTKDGEELNLKVNMGKAYGNLNKDELVNKRAIYILNKAKFGLTPRGKDGGLTAILGEHKLNVSGSALESGVLKEVVGGNKLSDKISDLDELWDWYTTGVEDYEEEYKGLTPKQKQEKRNKLKKAELDEPPHLDRNAWLEGWDVFVKEALVKAGWLTKEEQENFKKYVSWKGTPLETVKDGEIRLNDKEKKGAKIEGDGVITKAYITPEGLINVNSVTCGSVNSMGAGYVYKYTDIDEKNLRENMEASKDIVYSTGDYTQVLDRIKAYHKKHPEKNIFIFADPPYPEGQFYQDTKTFTYGKSFDQVKFEDDCYNFIKEVKREKVKLLVTNGYAEWLNQYLRWRVDDNGDDFWNIWRIIVGSRGGTRTKPREELIYSTYTPILPGGKEVKSHHPHDRDTSDNPDNKTKAEGKLNCMPKDEWKTLSEQVWKNMNKVIKGSGLGEDMMERFMRWAYKKLSGYSSKKKQEAYQDLWSTNRGRDKRGRGAEYI